LAQLEIGQLGARAAGLGVGRERGDPHPVDGVIRSCAPVVVMASGYCFWRWTGAVDSLVWPASVGGVGAIAVGVFLQRSYASSREALEAGSIAAGTDSVRTLFEPLEVECGVRCDVGVAGVDGLLVGSPGCVRVPLRRPVSRSSIGDSRVPVCYSPTAPSIASRRKSA